jgi:hypothetical protein
MMMDVWPKHDARDYIKTQFLNNIAVCMLLCTDYFKGTTSLLATSIQLRNVILP